ncbi:hypothetical protein [Aurantibacillus circumpalustris]|uniref:hypothetical protein n=1 Tax=Aurantibacillus circumpalustris TaxID=3036359 RepID=UPI00295A794F|nr:hypothetical protein [Aurantibacillus circumpalustris]
MKAVKLIIIGIALFLGYATKAQVSVNVNIGPPPQWGPVGYTEVRYYYLPDVEAYYDVQSSMFIYFGDGVWIHRAHLPGRHQHYDLYSGYKVVLSDYRGDRPYDHFKQHKSKYAKGYRHGTQKTYGQNPGKGNHHENNSSNNHSDRKTNNDHGSKNHGGTNTQSKSQGSKQHGHGSDHGEGHGGGKGKK